MLIWKDEALKCQFLTSENSVFLNTRNHMVRKFSLGQEPIAGQMTVGVMSRPVRIDTELVEQTVLVDPRLDEQASGRRWEVDRRFCNVRRLEQVRNAAVRQANSRFRSPFAAREVWTTKLRFVSYK